MDWLFAFLFWAVLLYEGAAILSKRRGDTISEHSWDARDYYWGRMFVDPLVIWLLWHLVIDDTFFQQGVSWVDLIVVGVAVLWAHFSYRWQHEDHP